MTGEIRTGIEVRKLFLITTAVFSLFLLLNGCSTPLLDVPKILEVSANARLYTAYNIWCENPAEISSLNYQKGKIIPFGTEVSIKEAAEDRIVFEIVPSGGEYTISYLKEYTFRIPKEEYLKRWEWVSTEQFFRRLVSPKEHNEKYWILKREVEYRKGYESVSIDDFIRNLFTTKNLAGQSEGLSPENLRKLQSGIVEPGMTKKEVLMAYGYPPTYRTPSLDEDTWIYLPDRFVSLRVVFGKDKGEDKVIEVLK